MTRRYSCFSRFQLFVFFLVSLSSKALALSASLQLQIEALEALYNSANGAKWVHSKGIRWSFPKDSKGKYTVDPCLALWEGIKCDSSKSSIISLMLSNSNLVGTIPSKLAQLSSLTMLDLSANNLRDNIPSSIGGLVSLTKLYLDGNSLSGSLPDEVWGIRGLVALQLFENKLEGTISPSIQCSAASGQAVLELRSFVQQAGRAS